MSLNSLKKTNMNTFSKKYGNKKNSIIFMIFVFMLLSNVTDFAQTSITNNVLNTTTENSTAENNVTKQETTSTDSSMNFVLWFMGSKQDPNVKSIQAGENTRRQFITSGLAPNRLLLKAFLKKAVNSEIAAV